MVTTVVVIMEDEVDDSDAQRSIFSWGQDIFLHSRKQGHNFNPSEMPSSIPCAPLPGMNLLNQIQLPIHSAGILRFPGWGDMTARIYGLQYKGICLPWIEMDFFGNFPVIYDHSLVVSIINRVIRDPKFSHLNFWITQLSMGDSGIT